MIVLHHLEHSRSARIAWLLEELGLAYEVKRYKRDPKTMLAPRALKAVHRLGKSPIVVDDGTVLVESGAIIEYLLARHGGGRCLVPPTGTPEHLAYLTFLHFAEGSMMPPLLLRLIFSTMRAKAPALARPLVRAVTAPVEALYVRPNLEEILAFLEDQFVVRPWFAGDAFSAADIQMSFPVEMAKARGGLAGSYPKLLDFLSRAHARPAHARALERIGEPTPKV